MPTVSDTTTSTHTLVPRVEFKKLFQPKIHHTSTSLKQILLYPTVNHVYDKNGKKQTIDSLRTSPQKEVWEKSLSNKWGQMPKATSMESMLLTQ